jgi:hypothetical protein
VRVELAAGDVLLVDNRRVLHGRAPLRDGGAESGRALRRLWVRSGGGSLETLESFPAGETSYDGHEQFDVCDGGAPPPDDLELGISLAEAELLRARLA